MSQQRTLSSESTFVTDPVRRAIDRRVPWAAHDEFFFHQAFGSGPALTQGWKLHVSATPLSAVEVLDAALDVLLAAGVRFKVVKSIELLRSLNAGQFGLTQIGKFITVYPSDDLGAVAIAVQLDEATNGRRGPRVPTDRPLRSGSLVHYRYGGMHPRAGWENPSEGAKSKVVLNPLVVDRDDIVQRTRCSLGHGGSFSLTWLHLKPPPVQPDSGPPALPKCAKHSVRHPAFLA
jgi:hypothetical protein